MRDAYLYGPMVRQLEAMGEYGACRAVLRGRDAIGVWLFLGSSREVAQRLAAEGIVLG